MFDKLRKIMEEHHVVLKPELESVFRAECLRFEKSKRRWFVFLMTSIIVSIIVGMAALHVTFAITSSILLGFLVMLPIPVLISSFTFIMYTVVLHYKEVAMYERIISINASPIGGGIW